MLRRQKLQSKARVLALLEQVQRTVEHFVKDLMHYVLERIVGQMRQVISQERVSKRSERHVPLPVLPTLDKELMGETAKVEQTISLAPVQNYTVKQIVDVPD